MTDIDRRSKPRSSVEFDEAPKTHRVYEHMKTALTMRRKSKTNTSISASVVESPIDIKGDMGLKGKVTTTPARRAANTHALSTLASRTGLDDAVARFKNPVSAKALMTDFSLNFIEATVRVEFKADLCWMVVHSKSGTKVNLLIDCNGPPPSVKRESLKYWLDIETKLTGKNGAAPPTEQSISEMKNFVVVGASNFKFPLTLVFENEETATDFVKVVILMQYHISQTKTTESATKTAESAMTDPS